MKRFISWVFALSLMTAVLPALSQGLKRTADPRERGYKDSDFPRVQQIAPNVYTYEVVVGSPQERYTTNSMFIVTKEGVLIADGQGSPAAVTQMLADIAKITPQPVKYMVMGSDHGDHTNGNSALPSGVEIIAHPNSKATLERQANDPQRKSTAKIVIPTSLVTDKRVIMLGGTEIRIQFLGRAHTGGDLVVYLPKEKVLFTSEIYLNHLFPAMRSAYPSEWMEVFKKIDQFDAKMIIPGHGFVDDARTLKEELTAYEKATAAIIAEATRLHNAGVPVEEAVKQAKWGEYESWSGAPSQGPIAVRRIYDDLDGKLKKP